MATQTVSVGGGNWSSNATWVSGGVPAATDDVVLASTSGSLTVDGADTCQSFTVQTGYTGTVTLAAGAGVLFSIGSTAAAASFTLLAGMNALAYTSGILTLASSSASCTFTSAGISIPWPISFTSTGTWTLQDALTCTSTITQTAGTFATNGKAVSCTVFASSGSTSRTTNITNSTVTCTAAGTAWNLSGSTNTMTATGSTIVLSDNSTSSKTFSGNGKTYGILSWPAAGRGTLFISGANTFTQILVPAGSGATARTIQFVKATTTTVTTTLQLMGTAALPLNVQTNTATTTGTVACSGASITADNASIRDITITGGPLIASRSVLVSNTSGISLGAQPPAVVVAQARQRPLRGRTVPAPHVAPPVVVHTPRFAPAKVIQALARALVPRRTIPAPHTAPPQVTLAAKPPVVTVPLVVGTQSRRRALAERLHIRAHTAPPTLTQPVVPPLPHDDTLRARLPYRLGGGANPATPPKPILPPTVVSRMGRFTGGVHAPWLQTLQPAPTLPPVAAGTFAAHQALRRALIGRTVPRPHLARPSLLPAPTVRSVIVSQARKRPLVGRVLLRAHVAPPNLRPAFPAGPPIPTLVRSGLIDSTLRRPAGRVWLAKPNLTPPVPAVVSQVLRPVGLPYQRFPVQSRQPIAAHLPPANLTPPVPAVVTATQGPVVNQSTRRVYTGRTVPFPTLAPPNLTPPMPPNVVSVQGPVGDQYLRRTALGRTVPAPHVAPPNLTPLVGFGTLTNTLIGGDGLPLVGVVVTARLVPPEAFRLLADRAEIMGPLATQSNNMGHWELILVRQANISVPSYWEITENVDPNQDRIYAVTVGPGRQTLYDALVRP